MFIFVPISKLETWKSIDYTGYKDYYWLVYRENRVVFYYKSGRYNLQGNETYLVLKKAHGELLEQNKDYSIKKIPFIQFNQQYIRNLRNDKSN